MGKRTIMHVDMDAFFAAVEQRDNEAYRNKPVIVGGLSERGVVSTCSYEARKFGVHSAMPIVQARRLCPQGIFLRGDIKKYSAVSSEIFAVFENFSPLIEPLSIDEAFLDLTGMDKIAGDFKSYAQKLKAAVKKETGLVASVGIAPNKFLAKLASDLEKPDGLTIIEEGDIERILSPLSVGKIWGVGKKTENALINAGYKKIGDIRNSSAEKLVPLVGERLAQKLFELANGIDEREVVSEHEVKSIGREMTFEKDIREREEIFRKLLYLSGEVGYRLRKSGKGALTVSLKVRTANFSTFTRQRTFDTPLFFDEDIYRTACELYKELNPFSPVRLLGVTAANLTETSELSLFEDNTKKEKLYGAVDELKKRFGKGIITKAQLIEKDE